MAGVSIFSILLSIIGIGIFAGFMGSAGIGMYNGNSKLSIKDFWWWTTISCIFIIVYVRLIMVGR